MFDCVWCGEKLESFNDLIEHTESCETYLSTVVFWHWEGEVKSGEIRNKPKHLDHFRSREQAMRNHPKAAREKWLTDDTGEWRRW